MKTQKRIFLLIGLLSLMMIACKENAKPIMTIDQVNEQWQTATIKGVKSADVMDMVLAFQKQWPTHSVAMLLEDLKLPVDEQQYISVYDPENDYLSFAEGSDDQDAERMEAHVWQRSNGHQLFGITFDQFSSDVKSFLAFYDYDPKQQTLVPETSLADLFTPSEYNVSVSYNLPQYGDLIQVNEFIQNWWMPLVHYYEWNGMKPCCPESAFDGMYDIINQFDEEYMTYEMDDFSKYALIDIDEDGEPEIWLSTKDEEYQAVLSVVEGQVKLLAGKDYKLSLLFYKGVVGNAGGCGTGCFYAQYTKLKDSAPEFILVDMQLYDFEKDEIGDEYEINGEQLTNDEGDAIIKSFGELVEPQVEWHHLVVPKG